MEIKDFNDLFIHELQDIASFEQQLVDALPKMAKAAENDQLREAIENHLDETTRHLERVKELLASVEAKPGRTKCAGMAGIIKEGDEALEVGNKVVRDAAIIGAAQRVEHYEMAAYGTARSYAELLGLSEAVAVLQEILEEEKAADKKLTELSKIANSDAQSPRKGTATRSR